MGIRWYSLQEMLCE